MHIVVNEELKAYIDPLSPEEHAALERSLLAEGCRDALVLWGEVLVDGHNRYGICQKHGLPFQTVQNQNFRSMEDVHLWMIDQHLGRRSVSDFQRGVLALRKREILADRNVRAANGEALTGATPGEPGDGVGTADAAPPGPVAADAPAQAPSPEPQPLSSREAIAKAARLSSSQVVMIEKIRKQAAPEVVAAVKAGALSLNAAAAVATLPQDEQRAAAMAGGDELKQAAKRVREAKRKPRDEADAPSPDTLQSLRDRVAELTAENEELRRQLSAWQAQPGT
ncbi:plasmid replication/partition related protein [Acidovorax sp. SUPP3434]|uniref:plasmid replication/partition related protein n=1 Tax=Acidovorax sp. SUPP3434 TaxID=2920880 RepID=UPI0023DE2239|nr:plasmid replication/partition related protein [Acidovorax sp. SUPP3434]GKS98768.1 plasmid replication/partition related protein [Acidovorax sp. SUPP3434]